MGAGGPPSLVGRIGLKEQLLVSDGAVRRGPKWAGDGFQEGLLRSSAEAKPSGLAEAAQGISGTQSRMLFSRFVASFRNILRQVHTKNCGNDGG